MSTAGDSPVTTADMEEKLRLVQHFPLRYGRPREIYMET